MARGPLSATATGIAYILAAMLCFSVLDAMGKALRLAGHPVGQIVWARNAGQFLIVILIFRSAIPHIARTRHLGLHSLRAVSQLGAAAFFFLSLGYIGLAEATAIMDLNPVLITLGAALIFAEKLGPRRIVGIVVALLGALIIIRPGSSMFTPAALLPLIGAVCYTSFALATRKVGRSENVWTAMFWSGAIATLLTSLLLPWQWVTPAAGSLLLFAGIGIAGTLAQLFMIRAFALADAGVIAPFGYIGILFAPVWGYVFFGELPDIWVGVGALVIVGAGLYVWHRETRVRQEQAAAE